MVNYNLITDDVKINPIILTGLPRSGKSFFTRYFSKKTSKGRYLIDDNLEVLINLYKYGVIKKKLFSYLFSYGLKKN